MPDYGPSHPWYREAKEYWRNFLPRYYRSLEESAELDQTLRETVQMTSEAIADLISKGLRDYEARELMMCEWLFPPGEEDLEESREPLEDDES